MRVVIPSFLVLAAAGCADTRQPDVGEWEQKISIIPRGMSCKEAGLGVRHITLAHPAAGTHAIDAHNSLTLGYYDESNTVFYFTNSSLRMTGVMVSAGDRTMTWEMPDGADGWPSLQGPPDAVTGEAPQPEEVTFCFDYELYVQPSPYANHAQRATWTITKTGFAGPLDLAEGESVMVDTTVTATPGPILPAGQYIDGPVFVENNSPFTVTVNKVRVAVGTINATVTCPSAGAFTLAPYAMVECSFIASVPTLADRNVVGSATVSHELKVSPREVMASFSAHNVGTTLFDRCAIITDEASPYAGNFLGSVCREDGPTAYVFSNPVGPFACGKFSVSKTATYTGINNAASGTARWTLNGRVNCGPRPTDFPEGEDEGGPIQEE
jgi:hypothetical protein